PEYGTQDGGSLSMGRLSSDTGTGWVWVVWADGSRNRYRAGHRGKFDLCYLCKA
ncbi:hypothetical protein KIPB_013080, partial [Kipferlia bialata]